jgi:hypothetical protein
VESQNEIGNQGQVIAISEGRHLIRTAVLQQRSSKIIMQNQVREFVRHIVREDLRAMDKQLRLSCSVEIQKMLDLQVCTVLEFSYPGHQTTFLTFWVGIFLLIESLV